MTAILRRLTLPGVFLLLGYGFWASPEVKQIAAGVAIFLFGMLSLEQGFKAFTGGILEQVLQRATRGLGRSIGFGVVTTTIMQSSSLVSVLTISFLSAGLISLAAGIGVIFGANLGTTTGAWLIAGLGLKVDIAAYAMPMLVFGVILVFQKSKALQGTGYILAGLGFLFLGIAYMKEGFESFKDAIDLSAYAVGGYRGLLLYTAIGVFATVVMQSSHATLVLTITALAAHQVSYENALALAIGSNLGTTISAILGAIGANVEGRRLAGAHLIFNFVTGLVAIVLIRQMILAVDALSAAVGIGADDYTLKLAVFHSLFNLLGLTIMVPFTGALVRLLTHLMPAPAEEFEQPMYLSSATMQLPETAIEAVRKETQRLYDRAVEIIAHGLALHRQRLFSDENLAALVRASRRPFPEDVEQRYEQSIKSIYSAIVEFTSQAPTGGDLAFGERLQALRNAGREVVEAVKALKHLQTNLLVHMRSPNPDVRGQYDAIRVQVATALRAVETLKAQPADTVTVLSLDAAKVQLEQSDLVANGELDGLIRSRRINARVATSLMNDASYAHDLCRDMLNAATVLFGPLETTTASTERSVALNEDEIEQAAGRQP
jgi:phosphate:Na+ symporter